MSEKLGKKCNSKIIGSHAVFSQFFCDPHSVDYIARIDERSTCVYVITAYTNKLCNHVLFHPAKIPETHGITCAPALIDEQFQKYSESKGKISFFVLFVVLFNFYTV